MVNSTKALPVALICPTSSQKFVSTLVSSRMHNTDHGQVSAVLEYLYKNDYTPRLLHNKRKDTWEIEDIDKYAATVNHHAVKTPLLKDTAI